MKNSSITPCAKQHGTRLMIAALPELQQIDKTCHTAASPLQEVPFKKLLGCSAVLDVDGQALTQEYLQFPTEPIRVFQHWGSISRNEEKSLQRLLVKIWRFRLDHFNRHNTQRPHVHFGAILLLLDDFGSHPVRSANHGSALRFLIREFGTKAKVGYKVGRELDIRSRRRRDEAY